MINIAKETINLALLSFLYFFFCGFFVLLLVNMFTQNMIWAFFENTLDISLINLSIGLTGMWIGIRFIAPIFKNKLKKENRLPFLIASATLMFFALVLSFFVLFGALNFQAKLFQLFNSLALLAFFVFMSYNYIIRDKV